MQKVFFTADLHVGSKNIIGYCNRPFSSVEEMDKALIDNWNNTVSNKDIIYILGDVIWGTNNYKSVLSKLNGQKHLILGNHDTKQVYRKLQIDGIIQSINQHKTITIENQKIFLSHYAHRTWNHSFYGGWMLFGHSHNTMPDYGLSTDVGVDKWNYKPVSFDELKEYFKDREILHNLEVRDDYNIYNINFHKHFTDKYIERINKEANYLEEILCT